MPTWLQETLTLHLHLSSAQQFGLAFLLGSFAVATWSDIKYLSAQREFLEVWLFFLACVLLYDVRQAFWGDRDISALLIKWCLIVLLSLLSAEQAGLGVLFRLAWGDVAALAAAASLLSPLLILVLFGAAKAISLVVGPLLARGRRYYAFMPVVTLATLAVLALGLLV
jgi:hypothetical protein